MLSEREVSAAVGSTAYGVNGDKLGTVEHFFVDDRTGVPTWISVATGLFGTRHSIVPAVDAAYDEDDGSLRLPVTADAVKSAPHLAGDHLDPGEETELRRHYGIEERGIEERGIEERGMEAPGIGDPGVEAPGLDERGGQPAAGGPAWPPPVPPPTDDRHADTAPDDRRAEDTTAMEAPTQQIDVVPPPPSTEDEHRSGPADGGMTRSEERLVVGTERVARTRARLVKYVVTEEVQITVPIRREEIRVEEVPLDAPDPGPGESLLPADRPPTGDRTTAAGYTTGGYDTGGYQLAGGLPDEIVLHTERPVVSVEVVPVERVRLRTETVQGQERVSGQVQREQIVLEQTPSPASAPADEPRAG